MSTMQLRLIPYCTRYNITTCTQWVEIAEEDCQVGHIIGSGLGLLPGLWP